MLVSGVQQSDSVTHIHVCILFQILFPFRLLWNIEQSSLCHTVGPCCLSILNIVVVHVNPPKNKQNNAQEMKNKKEERENNSG